MSSSLYLLGLSDLHLEVEKTIFKEKAKMHLLDRENPLEVMTAADIHQIFRIRPNYSFL